MTFAEKLKLIRKEKGLTQEDLAEQLEVSRQAVSKWESGSGYPETEKLLILSKRFNVSLDYLLLDDNFLEEQKNLPEHAQSHVRSGKIAITTFDNSAVINCISVKSSDYFAKDKNEPQFVLNGIDKVTFWGEHTTLLGWYATEADIKMEIAAIHDAIEKGYASYKLQYAANVKYVGFLQQPRIIE